MTIFFEKGSYRDPAGKVFYKNGKVYSGLNSEGVKRYNFIKDSKILEESIKNNFLIKTKEANNLEENNSLKDFKIILEHEKINFITYPYEWCFNQLKDAAIHQLNFQIFLLEKNCVLIDASAYNIQFFKYKTNFYRCFITRRIS